MKRTAAAKETHIYSVKAKVELDLPPAQTKDVHQGIRNYLNSIMFRFNKDLKGVVLGYRDERVVGSAAPVNTYFAYIHVHVEAEFSVFRPRAGAALVGTVNKVGSDYLGVLFLGTFNCSIPRFHIRRELNPDPSELEQTWQSRTDKRHVIRVGSHVRFSIVHWSGHLDHHFSLVGSLEPAWTGLLDVVEKLPVPAVGRDAAAGKDREGEKAAGPGPSSAKAQAAKAANGPRAAAGGTPGREGKKKARDAEEEAKPAVKAEDEAEATTHKKKKKREGAAAEGKGKGKGAENGSNLGAAQKSQKEGGPASPAAESGAKKKKRKGNDP